MGQKLRRAHYEAILVKLKYERSAIIGIENSPSSPSDPGNSIFVIKSGA